MDSILSLKTRLFFSLIYSKGIILFCLLFKVQDKFLFKLNILILKKLLSIISLTVNCIYVPIQIQYIHTQTYIYIYMFQSLSIIHFNLYPLSICRVSCGYCHSLYINSLFYLLIYFTLDVFISIFLVSRIIRLRHWRAIASEPTGIINLNSPKNKQTNKKPKKKKTTSNVILEKQRKTFFTL